MSKAARSVQIFALYIACVGAALLIAPNTLLDAFGIPPTNEVWIRVVGMLAGVLSVYYGCAARAEAREFFAWTVPVRLAVPFFFGAFVLWCDAPPALLIFGAADALAALWTWAALRDQPKLRD